MAHNITNHSAESLPV